MQPYVEDRMLEATPCLAAHAATEGLKTIRIVPWGRVDSKNGFFFVDEESADSIITSFHEHKTPMIVDYEHQSVGGKYAAPDGLVRAAGFIHKIWSEPERGIYAFVEWNPKARAMIRAGEYRYLSPAVLVRKLDRVMIGLNSVGLTNMPAIPNMERLAASENIPLETELQTMASEPEAKPSNPAMIIGEIKAALGITKAFGDDMVGVLEAIRDAITKKPGASDGDDKSDGGDAAVASSVRDVLGLSSNAGWSEVVLAMTTRDTNGAASELVAMREAEAEKNATELVWQYCDLGHINPNNKKQLAAAHSLARENPERFKSIVGAVVPNPPPGRTVAPPRRDSGMRSTVIANAARQYEASVDLQKTCSADASVNMALREAGLATMTEDEAREFVTT